MPVGTATAEMAPVIVETRALLTPLADALEQSLNKIRILDEHLDRNTTRYAKIREVLEGEPENEPGGNLIDQIVELATRLKKTARR